MSHGLPSITSAYGGTDYMIDKSCGIKVSPASEVSFVSGLSEAIDRLVLNESLRKRLSESAKLRARTFFDWTEKRKRMTSIYQCLFKKSQS